MPELRIGDESFACKESLPPWQLMKLAKAEQQAQRGDVMAAMAGMYDFVTHVVTVEDRPKLEAFLDEWDGEEDEFNEAIGTLMESYADRPTGRSKPSRSGPSATGQQSRVVSLSPATAREDKTSSQDGASVAS